MRVRIAPAGLAAYVLLTIGVASALMWQWARPATDRDSTYVSTSAIPKQNDLAEFVRRLSDGLQATLAIPSADAPEIIETFVFDKMERPVPDDFLPADVLFARGEVAKGSGSGHTARVIVIGPAHILLSVFTDEDLFWSELEPELAIEFHRLVASKDLFGRTCLVTREQDEAAVKRFQLPALVSPDDVRTKGLFAGAPARFRRFRIAIAVTDKLRAEIYKQYDPIVLRRDVARLLFDTNELLTRDLGVELKMSGPLHLAPEDGYSNQLNLAEKYFDRELTPAEYAEADLGHILGHGGGGRGEPGSLCADGFKLRGVSNTIVRLSQATLEFAHEIGHQLGAPHSFSEAHSFWDFFHPRGAYEPDSGRSIMSWEHDKRRAYFHASSIDVIERTLSSSGFPSNEGCAEDFRNPLRRPDVETAEDDWHVPPKTAFELSALPNATVESFRWDEYDKVKNPGEAPPYFASSGVRGISRVYTPRAGQRLSAPSLAWPASGTTLRFRVLGFGPADASSRTDVDVKIGPGGPFVITHFECSPCTVANGKLTVHWDAADTLKKPYKVRTLTASLIDEETHQVYALPGPIPNGDGWATRSLPANVLPTGHARLMLHADEQPFFARSETFAITTK